MVGVETTVFAFKVVRPRRAGYHRKWFKIQCPKCSAEYEVGDDQAGARARCGKCKTVFPVDGTSLEDVLADLPPPPLPRWFPLGVLFGILTTAGTILVLVLLASEGSRLPSMFFIFPVGAFVAGVACSSGLALWCYHARNTPDLALIPGGSWGLSV